MDLLEPIDFGDKRGVHLPLKPRDASLDLFVYVVSRLSDVPAEF